MKIIRISLLLVFLVSIFACKPPVQNKGTIQNNEENITTNKAKFTFIKVGKYSLTNEELIKASSTLGFAKVFPEDVATQVEIKVFAENGVSFTFLNGATKDVTLTKNPQTIKIKASKTGCEDTIYTLILSKEEEELLPPYQPSKYEEMIDVFVPESGIVGKTFHKNNLVKDGVFLKGRTVKLSKYKIGKYELTYKVWHEVAEWARTKGYKFSGTAKEAKSGGIPNVSPTTEDFPITALNWYDAIVWCNAYTEKVKGKEHCVYRMNHENGEIIKDATQDKLDQAVFWNQKKKGFRLPSEAEWEYAARYQKRKPNKHVTEKYGSILLASLDMISGATVSYRGSSTIEEVYKYCWWFDKDRMEQSEFVAHKVGSKAKNNLGIYDMSGNLQEWVYDWYVASEEKTESVMDPIGPAFQAGITSEKVLKGGSYKSPALYHCLPTSRNDKRLPTKNDDEDCGIRLACYE